VVKEDEMKVYNVAGSATGEDISAQAEPFSMNVCAMGKNHACEIAARDMETRGYRGVVVVSADSLPGDCGMYTVGDTLLIGR
jgi:hypothetical protein